MIPFLIFYVIQHYTMLYNVFTLYYIILYLATLNKLSGSSSDAVLLEMHVASHCIVLVQHLCVCVCVCVGNACGIPLYCP
jgi:hypothetical protein